MKIMTFLEALNSGKKVKSQHWDDKHSPLDTTLFTDKLDDFIIDLMNQTATPLTWKEILGKWYEV